MCFLSVSVITEDRWTPFVLPDKSELIIKSVFTRTNQNQHDTEHAIGAHMLSKITEMQQKENKNRHLKSYKFPCNFLTLNNTSVKVIIYWLLYGSLLGPATS